MVDDSSHAEFHLMKVTALEQRPFVLPPLFPERHSHHIPELQPAVTLLRKRTALSLWLS